MELFLSIVAGIFVGFLLIVLTIYLFIRWWLRRMVRQLAAFAEDATKGIVPFMQPLRVNLRRERDPEWSDEDAIEAVVLALQGVGFEDAGVFTMEEVPDVMLQALAHPEKGVYAVVYEHPDRDVWFEFVSRYEDGSTLTYTTSPATGLDRPPNKQIERFDADIEPAKLYQQHVALRPQDGLSAATAKNFKADFERAYAEEMDWRFERGGFTEAEIRTNLKLEHNETADQKVKQVHAMQQAQVSQWLQTKLKETYRVQANIPTAKWRKIEDRLIFIHDRMTDEEVGGIFSGLHCWDDDDDDLEEVENLSCTGPAREVFARMLKQHPPKRAVKKVGHLSEPLAADVYLGPGE